MKLLFCPRCWDLFKLSGYLRSCECGDVSGRYVSQTKAEVNGRGLSLGIDNLSLIQAKSDVKNGATRAAIDCWARPHSGPANPNTVEKP